MFNCLLCYMKNFLFVFAISFISFTPKPMQAQNEVKPSNFSLSVEENAQATPVTLKGQELLIEGVDSSGRIGIYSLNVLDDATHLKVLAYGATTPRWSVRHEKILFFKNNVAYTYGRDGKSIAWDKDKIQGRFTTVLGLQENRIWWDYSGKANFIYNWLSSGSQLSRSIGLSENRLSQTSSRLQGFLDQITPINKDENTKMSSPLLCVGAASVSPAEDFLAAQVYPSLPRNLGKNSSTIRLYTLIYSLSRKDQKQWEDKLKANGPNFYSDSVVPQVDGVGQVIGSPNSTTIDIDPLFSPSGKYIAFTRVDLGKKSVYPLIVDVTNPTKALPVQIDLLANENAFYPDQVWGWPHHFGFKWDTTQDSLWLISGHEEKSYIATLSGGVWKSTLVCGLTLNSGPYSYYTTYKDWFCFAYKSQPSRIYLVNAKTGEKDVRTFDLPTDMQLLDLQW